MTKRRPRLTAPRATAPPPERNPFAALATEIAELRAQFRSHDERTSRALLDLADALTAIHHDLDTLRTQIERRPPTPRANPRAPTPPDDLDLNTPAIPRRPRPQGRIL